MFNLFKQRIHYDASQTIKVLLEKGATVYLAARSEEKATTVIKELENALEAAKGRLHFLKVDLADAKSAKIAAEEFKK